MVDTQPNQNGRPLATKSVEERLAETLTQGYVPTVPWAVGQSGTPYPVFQLRANIEQMLWHPMVSITLEYFKSGTAGAEFWGGKNPDDPDDEKGLPISDNPKVASFVSEQCERFWDRGVPLIQESGYPYGWSASEQVYIDDPKEGVLRWDSLKDFAPQDTYILTQDSKPIGVRVKSVKKKGDVDLWMASGQVPAKGLWYAHMPRYGQHYGRSQLMGAWLPWRRVAWRDGAEMNVDMAVYRFGYPGVVTRYPNEDLQNPPGTPYSKADSQGLPRSSARDVMKRAADQYKAGGTVGLPSDRYPKEMGGDYKYTWEVPKTVLNPEPLDKHIKTLYDQIAYGIGVPPELMQAAETGSGYSGRMIPMEAFLDTQQRIADRLLQLFVEQVLKPLVLWNFGDVRWEVKVKRLLLTKADDRQGEEQGGGAKQPAMDGGSPDGQFSHRLAIAERVRSIAREALRRAA